VIPYGMCVPVAVCGNFSNCYTLVTYLLVTITASLRFVLDLVCNLFLRLQLQQLIDEISTCEGLSVVAELLVLCGMVCGVVEFWAL